MDKMNIYKPCNNTRVIALSLFFLLFFMACQSTTHKSQNEFRLSNLINTQWKLSSLNNNKESLDNQSGPKLSFTDEGKVFGFTGCNRFQAHFTLSKNRLTISPLMMTRRFCAETAALENTFTKVLETVYFTDYQKEELFLKNKQGKIMATFLKK
jgi:heat shock protein HslJ